MPGMQEMLLAFLLRRCQEYRLSRLSKRLPGFRRVPSSKAMVCHFKSSKEVLLQQMPGMSGISRMLHSRRAPN